MSAYLLLVFFMLPVPSLSVQDGTPALAFNFVDWGVVFRAGETAAIKVDVLKDFESEQDRHSFNPNVSMNGVIGNSSLITDLRFDIVNWTFFFMPIMEGSFNVLITDTRFGVMDSSLQYYVAPGPIYEPGGVVSWIGQMHDFVAGTKATVFILPKDAFGNNVTRMTEGQIIYHFDVYATSLNGSKAKLVDISYKGWDEFGGYICIEFVAVTAGHLLVHIKDKNSSLIGSPLSLTVHPDVVDVANCLAHWSTETKSFQLLSKMETFISQRDKFGNLVTGLYEFDIEVLEKGSKWSLPICELRYKEVSPGIQSFSFTVVKPGDFILIISDNHNKKIMNMPYEFNVHIGYCDDLHSVVNGSGLNDSVAGEVSRFSISLNDAFQYPSPIELERLHVQIALPSLSLSVNPHIHPRDSTNGTQPTGMLSYDAFGSTGMTYAPSVFSHDDSVEDLITRSNEFDVSYVAEKAGVYEIRVFCGNIPLNGGHPFIKVVSAAEANLSISGVVKYRKKASAGILNDLLVRLVDSFYNPILSQEGRLKLVIASKDGSFFPCRFYDNYDGTYSGCYQAYSPGYYELCISYAGKRLLPWPFGVHVLDNKLFPTVHNDTVTVWEDQSTAFNVLENDIFFDGEGRLISFEKPSHGSLLQYGTLLRYTPYKGYYGYDKFVYRVVDPHGNFGAGEVDINVLTNPPKIVSFPKQLQAVEDTLSPRFGGFSGFEIGYSDPLESISVILTARNGTLFLSLLLMRLWHPMWNELTVTKMEGTDKCLNITGRLEVVNFALKSLQYIGNANFSGEDVIAVSTININGKGHMDVPIHVEPVNDPPVINVPKFIILENENENKGFLIFDRQRDTFNFFIGDPDHHTFPGNETDFRVMFSVEVSFGTLSAKLPAQLISTTEVKLQRSKQWQPLETFVKISKHFTLNNVKGVRILGTINECNTLLQQLVYYGDKHVGVLKLRVNDMGWYGCYRDCSEMMSAPLMSEATVNLITGTPMNTLVAHSLGLVIVIEFIVLSSLAVILMFFTCKCVIILLREKKKRQAESPNLQT
ncbi:protein GAMETE EXPRESSED 2-like [Bidens hawaiensis]|uniref:protein GAMETE EXPRESSED 2-like n=1 Tax=Bidens hawaiensis TaxID=980011 RepID=UPI004049ADC0